MAETVAKNVTGLIVSAHCELTVSSLSRRPCIPTPSDASYFCFVLRRTVLR